MARSVWNELAAKSSYIELYVVYSTILSEFYCKGEFGGSKRVMEYNISAGVAGALLGNDVFLDNYEKKVKPDIVFTLFGPSYWRPKAPHLCGFAKAQYVYLDSPYFNSYSLLKLLKFKVKKWVHEMDFKYNNDILVTENQDVASLIGLKYAKTVETIWNTHHQIFNSVKQRSQERREDVFRILTVSSYYPHKNLEIIPLVAAHMRQSGRNDDFEFIITTWPPKNLVSTSIGSNIKWIGPQSLDSLPDLYANSDLLFLPTFLECFSASWSEAMIMGVPILTSDYGFSRAICGEAAYYIDPTDLENIVDGIFELEQNEFLKNELVEFGYQRVKKFGNSNSRAEGYLRILKSMYETSNTVL